MNKKLKWLVLSPLILASSSSLASCSNNDGYLLLRVINSEDYIYLNDPTDPESAPDLIHQFEDSEAVKAFLETKYPQYKGVKVIYDTSDTNETLYSELQTGKTNYDLMNVSDYMAQKIVSNGLAVPLYEHGCTIDNYFDYASVNIKTRLDNIIAKQKYYDSEEGKIKTKDLPLADYAVGYMWGTLGILFNSPPAWKKRFMTCNPMELFGIANIKVPFQLKTPCVILMRRLYYIVTVMNLKRLDKNISLLVKPKKH